MTRSASFMTGGDVAPIREDGTGMLGATAHHFRAADVSFVNLEHALSTSGELLPGREFYHRGPPACADGLSEAELSAVNLANNHIFDYGAESLRETWGALAERSIPSFGAGRNLGEARARCIVEGAGVRVALLGFTTTLPRAFAATDTGPGVNPMRVHTAYEPHPHLPELPGLPAAIVTWADHAELARLRADVGAAAEVADVVLVYVHWGTSMTPRVHDFQREIGRSAIDAGAHAVFGGHQHVLSAVEFYKGSPIVHSTGNLLFDKWEPFFTAETRKTALVSATLRSGEVCDVVLLPARSGVGDTPKLLGKKDPLWREIFEDLKALCGEFGTALEVTEDGIAVRDVVAE